MTTAAQELDAIEELKLRRWARENYVDDGDRDQAWHPVILDEMTRRDIERSAADEL